MSERVCVCVCVCACVRVCVLDDRDKGTACFNMHVCYMFKTMSSFGMFFHMYMYSAASLQIKTQICDPLVKLF